MGFGLDQIFTKEEIKKKTNIFDFLKFNGGAL